MLFRSVPEEALKDVLSGTGECYYVDSDGSGTTMMTMPYEGLVKYIESSASDEASAKERRWAESFSTEIVCPECNGQRLNKEALHYYIDGKNIAEVSNMTLTELSEWIKRLPTKLNERQQNIAPEIIKEIHSRINFLLGVGIGYLSLNRPSM